MLGREKVLLSVKPPCQSEGWWYGINCDTRPSHRLPLTEFRGLPCQVLSGAFGHGPLGMPRVSGGGAPKTFRMDLERKQKWCGDGPWIVNQSS